MSREEFFFACIAFSFMLVVVSSLLGKRGVSEMGVSVFLSEVVVGTGMGGVLTSLILARWW